jgi:hypothetical protein
MERFVGLSLKQGMENPGIEESRNLGIRESGNPGIGESGNRGIVLIYNTNLYLN